LLAILHYGIQNKSMDYFLMVAFSCGVVLFFCNSALPNIFSTFFTTVSKCLLELYLIHGYLFVSVSSHKSINFSLSLLLIFPVAAILQKVSSSILAKFHSREA